MAQAPFTHALVTGASSGIGESVAHKLGKAGVGMVLVARRKDRLEAIAAQYPNVEVLVADLTTQSGLDAVISRLQSDSLPLIDLVVNNAGFGTSGAFVEADPQRLSNEISLNVNALTRISHEAIRQMQPRGRGFLLNVSSIASFQPGPELAVYAATKAFVTSLTEALHEELRGSGIRVTALCPGLTRTEFQSVSNTSGLESTFPDFAWMSADDVARDGLRAVADGKAICVPGLVNKSLAMVSTFTPRGLARRIAGLATRLR
ncbi:MAG: SDR family oxidoreductase [Ilumatobacteraceae bacterium]|nr:SDR family oxidoreductase [Ilumatobacteraceae bacterium]